MRSGGIVDVLVSCLFGPWCANPILTDFARMTLSLGNLDRPDFFWLAVFPIQISATGRSPNRPSMGLGLQFIKQSSGRCRATRTGTEEPARAWLQKKSTKSGLN